MVTFSNMFIVLYLCYCNSALIREVLFVVDGCHLRLWQTKEKAAMYQMQSHSF